MSERGKVDLEIVDTSEKLTLEELKELKKLAGLSKATRVFLGLIFGIVGIIGVPVIIDWLSKGHN